MCSNQPCLHNPEKISQHVPFYLGQPGVQLLMQLRANCISSHYITFYWHFSYNVRVQCVISLCILRVQINVANIIHSSLC